MALSNSQYDQLMRTYEQKQLDNEHQLREHYRQAYSFIPELEELDQSISAMSVQKARRLLDGDSQALSSLKEDELYEDWLKIYEKFKDLFPSYYDVHDDYKIIKSKI